MAQKVFVELLDDIDGSEADETVPFGIDGKNYVIDLNKKNAAALRKTLDKYVQVARRDTNSRKRGGRSSISGPSNYGEARVWAAEKGIDVPSRGRLSAEFMAAFEAGNVSAAKKALSG
jgi:hypothetical protein